MRIISKFNLFTRRVLGSAGPISPGRAAIVGGSAYGVIHFGLPKLMNWMGREAWVASGTATVLGTVITMVVVEGVCYFAGNDPEVHAEMTAAALKELAEDYLAVREREDALVKMTGLDADQVHMLLVTMRDARPAPAEESKRATG